LKRRKQFIRLKTIQAGRHHPEEQGLKLTMEKAACKILIMAGRHHPEEQGLKPVGEELEIRGSRAGRHHPEEQGLKRIQV